MGTTSRAWYWALIVFVITSVYLVFELSFSSELLNIVGQNASTADINSIEHWGRYLSGFAAGLVFWSVFTPTRFIVFPVNISIKVMLLFNLVLTSLVAGLVYHYEMDYVHNAKNENSGTLRKDAVYASFIRSGLLNGTIKLTGMPKNTAAYHTPEGKAFIALLPLLASSDANLAGKITGVLPDLVKENIEVKSGGSREFYNNVFLPSARVMVAKWVQYQHSVAQLNAGYTSANSQPRYIAQETISRVNTIFNTEINSSLANPKDPNPQINPNSIHDMQEFYENPIVIHYWTNILHMPYYTQAILPNFSYNTVKNTLWKTYLNTISQRQMKSFESNTSQFKNGQPYALQGENAMVLLTVPALALILSVLGMMVHAGKSVYYLQKVLGFPFQSSLLKFLISLGVFIGIGILFYLSSTVITQSSLYQHLSQEYAGNPAEFWPSYWLTWVIQAERYVYPVAECIRNTVLFGYHFGVSTSA